MRALLGAAVLLAAGLLASAGDPSFPAPGTGTPSCLLPISTVFCTVDTRSGFVAGLQYGDRSGFRVGYGALRLPQYGLRGVCSRGASSEWNIMRYAQTIQQTTWDMTNTSDPSFPKNTTGQPNLQYFYPYGGLITQMIVLEAKNPNGDSFGTVPAVIFRYIFNSSFGFAVCGNARYANAYLNPLTSPPPPTTPVLQSQFVNPLSATNPQMYLASFNGKCSERGYGYLGGDPQTQSYWHLKSVYDACFAPPANRTFIIPTPGQNRPEVDYNWNVTHTPCYWNKKASKLSASISCALTGEVVATGKYGVISVSQEGQPVEPVPGLGGKLQAVQFSGDVFEGTQPAAA